MRSPIGTRVDTSSAEASSGTSSFSCKSTIVPLPLKGSKWEHLTTFAERGEFRITRLPDQLRVASMGQLCQKIAGRRWLREVSKLTNRVSDH
eukprot:scaffold166041_cov36-Tisochrysis_lutea.AAC.2